MSHSEWNGEKFVRRTCLGAHFSRWTYAFNFAFSEFPPHLSSFPLTNSSFEVRKRLPISICIVHIDALSWPTDENETVVKCTSSNRSGLHLDCIINDRECKSDSTDVQRPPHKFEPEYTDNIQIS